ncbi:transporter substrate-binding domain-containing protein [Marinomonas sp. 15G1-11]|uniref:Transporter substrate-binding domain-containing protein n=1 Tax=Marinomonas phaeophyticola TaxID=3004091 RepID=A0ABT4JV61_9GAMM|nr:transporter substrate-binding domain-containing protein [Marinomonas sp. 15G1-11]MCZ2722257.1 transporter substrate-binding domain-containing protein [Marinomonas sp. 15G1-11]
MQKVALFLLLGWFSSLALAEKAITFHIGEWPPYTSENILMHRLAEKLVEESFASQGYKTLFEYHPWKRSFTNVKFGNADATFPWYETDQRNKNFVISKEALFRENQVFFYLKKKAFDWNTFEDLKKYQIGGTIGYNNVNLLEKNDIRVFVVSEESFNFRMLLAGRIDAYPAGALVGYEIIHSLFTPEQAALFTTHPKTLKEGDMHVLFSKKVKRAQEYADAFDRGLLTLKSSGRYEEIMNSYMD